MNPTELLNKKFGLLKLTMSTFIIQLMQILVNNFDQLMVSRYSQPALAAVGNANQVSWVLMLLFTVLSMSSVILITQYKGAGNKQREKEIYAISLAVNIVLGLVIGVVLTVFGRQIFTLMNVTDPEILRQAYSYLAITGGGSVFISIIMIYSSFLRSNAMVKEAMIVTISVNLFNILGNWVLIYGVGPFPELGASGAALSTLISRILGCIFISIVFARKVGRIEWKLLKPFPKDQLIKLVKIGVPAAGESFSYDASQLVITSFVNTMGLVAINTKICVQLIVSFSYIFANSIGEATQVMEGYLLGQQKHEEAYRRVRKSAIIGFIVTIILTVFIYLCSDQLLGLYISNDPEIAELRSDILALGKKIMMVELLLEAGRAINLVIVKALQTAGDIKYPVILCVISAWLIAVGFSWVLGLHLAWGLVGVWVAMAADECGRSILLSIRWKRGRWRKIDIIADDRLD